MNPSPSIVAALSEDELLRHVRFVQALARELVGDAHAADDVAQEAWTRALAFAPRSSAKLGAWLAAIVRNTASKLVRGERRRVLRERATSAGEPARSSAELAARIEAHQHVVRAVLALPEPYRSTVVLRFFCGLAPRAIAREHRLPFETVRSRLKRAIELLRHDLDHSFGDRDAWCAVLIPLAATQVGAAALLTFLITIMTSTTKVALAALAALTITATAWLCLRDPKPVGGHAPVVDHRHTRDGEALPVGVTRSAVSESTSRPLSPDASASGAEAVARTEAAFLVRGRIEVLESGVPIKLPITLYFDNPADEADTLLNLTDEIEFVADQQADVTAGEPYAIPMPRAGTFPTRVGSVRAANQAWSWSHATDGFHEHSIVLARAVRVHLSGPAPADLAIVPSYLGDGGYRAGSAALHTDADEWTVPGPVLLPLRLELTSAAWLEPWQLTCVSPDVTAALPTLTRSALVRDADTGRPVTHARVALESLVIVRGIGQRLWRLVLASDQQGAVSLPEQALFRTSLLEVTADGYEPYASASLERLADDQGRLVIDLMRSARSRCTLVDVTGRPILGARVVVLEQGGVHSGVAGVTDADGRFVLASRGASWPPLPKYDPRVLVIERDGTASVLGPVPLGDLYAGTWCGVLADARVELQAELVAEDTGRPTPGRAFLFVAGGDEEGQTISARWMKSDRNGRVVLGSVRSGTWMLRAQAEGYAPVRTVVSTPGSGVVRIVLRRAVDRIAVRVVDALGAPRARQTVVLRDPDDAYLEYEATTDGEGRVVIAVAHPGEYGCWLALRPDAPERGSVTNPATARVGAGELVLKIVPTVAVTFDLRFADGTQPDPAHVVSRGPSGRGMSSGWGWSPATPVCTLPDEPCEIEIIAHGAKSTRLAFPDGWDREHPIAVILERE